MKRLLTVVAIVALVIIVAVAWWVANFTDFMFIE
jgi:hypothetical protein